MRLINRRSCFLFRCFQGFSVGRFQPSSADVESVQQMSLLHSLWGVDLLFSSALPSSASQGIVGKSCRSEKGSMIQILLDVFSCYKKGCRGDNDSLPFPQCSFILFHSWINGHTFSQSTDLWWFYKWDTGHPETKSMGDVSCLFLLFILCLYDKFVSLYNHLSSVTREGGTSLMEHRNTIIDSDKCRSHWLSILI